MDKQMTVVGIDTDGCLICRDPDGSTYNSGETPAEFGLENLTESERAMLAAIAQEQA